MKTPAHLPTRSFLLPVTGTSWLFETGATLPPASTQRMFDENCAAMVQRHPAIDEKTRGTWARLCSQPNGIVERFRKG